MPAETMTVLVTYSGNVFYVKETPSQISGRIDSAEDGDFLVLRGIDGARYYVHRRRVENMFITTLEQRRIMNQLRFDTNLERVEYESERMKERMTSLDEMVNRRPNIHPLPSA